MELVMSRVVTVHRSLTAAVEALHRLPIHNHSNRSFDLTDTLSCSHLLQVLEEKRQMSNQSN